MQNSALILASLSPRRHTLLEEAGILHRIIPSHVEERILPGEPPHVFVVRTAQEKAGAVSRLHPESLVLAADTVIVHRGTILGKPETPRKTRDMIRVLSGAGHQVISGVALMREAPFLCRTECVTTHVTFRELADREIEAYVATGEGLDKAGGYGIQGRGGALVDSVEGSWTNVVGLPMELVQRWLSEMRP